MAEASEIAVSDGESAITVAGSGFLDLYNEKVFRKALDGAIASGKEAVVDLRAATYIDTAIVAHLAVAGKAMMRADKRMKVMVAAGSHPAYVLKIVGFDCMMDITTDTDAPT